MLWIFLWDDEIDEGSSEVAQNKAHAELYVQQSMEYARLGLGVTQINASNGESKHNGDMVQSSIDLSALCPVATMTYFCDACPALRGYLDEGLIVPSFLRTSRGILTVPRLLVQRHRLVREIGSFMQSTIQEQTFRKSGKIPTLGQYLELRDLTSGIYPVIAIFESVFSILLPLTLLNAI
ncbi:terpene synthase family metal binding domain-containing protein [Penicillium herquei]|nr:terpene synthase family metal binding domain-containing protein [Penicillium herquei]